MCCRLGDCCIKTHEPQCAAPVSAAHACAFEPRPSPWLRPWETGARPSAKKYEVLGRVANRSPRLRPEEMGAGLSAIGSKSSLVCGHAAEGACMRLSEPEVRLKSHGSSFDAQAGKICKHRIGKSDRKRRMSLSLYLSSPSQATRPVSG